MNEEPKAFEFAELPQTPVNGPQEVARRKRGRRRGVAPKVVRKRAVESDLIERPVAQAPNKHLVRREMILKAITVMQSLEPVDARYVANLFA